MEKIKELIKEGEELRSTFTKEGVGSNLTTDREVISEWNTKCTLELRKMFALDDPLYKKFEGWINEIGSMTLDDFNELIGVLKGIEKTPEDEDSDDVFS